MVRATAGRDDSAWFNVFIATRSTVAYCLHYQHMSSIRVPADDEKTA